MQSSSVLMKSLAEIFLMYLEGTLSNEISPQLRAGWFKKQKSNGQFAFHIFHTQWIPTAYHRRKKIKILPDALCWAWHSGCLQNKHHLTPPWASAHFKNEPPLRSYTPNLIVKSHGPVPLISYLLWFILIRWGDSKFNFGFLEIRQFGWSITQKNKKL